MSTSMKDAPSASEQTARRNTSGVIDTSKMSAGERNALELTEEARGDSDYRSFAGELFMGRFPIHQIFPFPEQPTEDVEAGRPFLSALEKLLQDVDADRIDEEGEIPDAVIDRLAKMGAFGIKIPKEYGGLGLSQTNYCHAATLLGGIDGNLSALISAHQSIGVPQPLKLFGTDEQKKKYLPRVAKGEISAFALTEESVGSDPAKMTTMAEPTADGEHFVINGEKLWCTNGTKAGVIIVMARTPDREVRGRKRNQITAFIVEMNTPGVEVVTRCHFMGLRALYNGVIHFKDVKVPKTNIVGGEGRGLKVALTTLNTGRLTIPAGCVGFMKRCLQFCRDWANEREQWGSAIGKHAAIADKIARIGANIFASESMMLLTAALVDKKNADIRIEAAMCKMWVSEAAWRAIDETMQIRGGRGYETASSLKNRGSKPIPVERMMRDSRINLIFEGSSEIMRLFLAREALDPHLTVAGAALDSRIPIGKRLIAALKAGGFYALWYPGTFLPAGGVPGDFTPELRHSLAYASSASKRLARALFHSMAAHGPKLDKQQILLGRLVDIGTELFAIVVTALRADSLIRSNAEGYDRGELVRLVEYFTGDARLRVEASFRAIRRNTDRDGYKLAQEILGGGHVHLSKGLVESGK